MQADTDGLPLVRGRVSQACDSCKQRKVKCDGQTPCSYCKRRRQAHSCHFSPPVRRRRRRRLSEQATSSVFDSPSNHSWPATPAPTPTPIAPVLVTAAAAAAATLVPADVSSTLTRHGDVSAEEEAEVPHDARLICDAQGKLVFIGDCAPLSLFQTVRQIVTSRVDPHAFTPETSQVSMLENIDSEGLVPLGPMEEPDINPSTVQRLAITFLTVTSGLVDLFDNTTLVPELQLWAAQAERPADVTSAVRYLVLAIGSQSEDEQTATTYFLRGKHLALSALAANLSVGTVQSFLLTTLYMLRSCQINAAFLFFGIAARAAYAIGLHRTEVNSRFGAEIHTRRDRLWKSVRVLDLYLSISMGRPPAAADADCTVPYHATLADGRERYDLLNASLQVLSLVERICREVYSRRKISPQLTEGISRQLREWSGRWLPALLRAAQAYDDNDDRNDDDGGCVRASGSRDAAGACHVLSSYYYAVMLVSRPFLMYELCRRLPPEGGSKNAARPRETGTENNNGSGRAKLANACIDAATLLIGLISDFVEHRPPHRRMPLIVPWLFASSLVVGVGLLGGFGRALEKPARASVDALGYFAAHDAHAAQYARIASSLRICAAAYLERQEAEDRRQITEDSTRLFGLMPHESAAASRRDNGASAATATTAGRPNDANVGGQTANRRQQPEAQIPGRRESARESWETGLFDDFDPAVFSFGDGHASSQHGFPPPQEDVLGGADQVFGGINLFPLLDGNGHIDLAHLL